MPQQQGEVSLLTLFADIHYYFNPPTSKLLHHRFDKSSYVYLYQNPMQQRGRIEIANHAGTPDQDAFMGFMDSVRVEQSYKHPTLFTITVEGQRSERVTPSSSPQQDLSQWHLPAPDQRNDGRYMYRLHTIDIYFWTTEDSTMFLDSLRRVLQASQLQILEAPNTSISEHRDTMSPVVEKLEQAAITKPFPSRSDSISTTQSFTGPPTAPIPSSIGAGSPQPAEVQNNYAPMAYNPAAPAAPEPIAHREKTPPPPDAEDGTGLAAAAIHDHGGQFGAPPLQASYAPQSTGNQPYMPGPPRQPTQAFPGPPNPGLQRANTAGSFLPPPPPPQGANAGPHPGLQRQATMPTTQYANYPSSPGFPPMQSPGHPPLYSPGLPPTPSYPPAPSPGFPPSYAPAPSPGLPPAGGYSQYAYGQSPPASERYQVHNQLYRPTEAEAKHGHKPSASETPHQPGRFEQRADKLEKGVSRFLKKLDKGF
ncbi:hypothetical protein K432DRAFT_356699 [Lepidopterella palustris CBS 459.81]|uniref:RNA recognition motif-containing protein n=1 Tax=Lepidopterella palustris CBS 459.81 TaxID=1314670 RepID=A0A8E2E7B4_9PEZI|nr:hypothetical protein K432DRAFT_356699 [Lepidopterella palustris CBS 459.81]